MMRPILLVVLCALLLGAEDARSAGFEIRSRQVAGTTYLLFRDVATYYGMDYAQRDSSVTLRSRYSTLQFTADRRDATLNGVRVHLSFAPTIATGEALLSATDFQLLLEPILRPAALPTGRVRRVMIDPGHGGKDRGTRGRRYEEKAITLAVARRTARLLQGRGYQVALTRDQDREVSLGERTAMARRWGADVFVSIHANHVGTASVQGIETFLVAPAGTPATYASKSGASCSGNRHDRQNARLAFEVQRALIQVTGAADRGIKHSRFLVLRQSDCPAILVETGFMSHAVEDGLLGTAAYQEKLAAGITEGLDRYAKSLLRE